jgi:hypothetical protein
MLSVLCCASKGSLAPVGSSATDGTNEVLFVATTACCDEGTAYAGSVLGLVRGSVTTQPLPLKS